MGRYRSYTSEIEVTLDDWNDEELLTEIQNRGISVAAVDNPEESNDLLNEIWRLRRNGEEYDHLMDKLLYNTLGVVV